MLYVLISSEEREKERRKLKQWHQQSRLSDRPRSEGGAAWGGPVEVSGFCLLVLPEASMLGLE